MQLLQSNEALKFICNYRLEDKFQSNQINKELLFDSLLFGSTQFKTATLAGKRLGLFLDANRDVVEGN